METELAATIIAAAKQAGVTRLGLTPIVGEPLVHRKLEDFIRLARAEPNRLQVGLTTNGILLTPARYRSLVEAGINNIDISMSYPDEQEYRRIYRSPKLKTVVANIEGILSIYNRADCAMNVGAANQPYAELGRSSDDCECEREGLEGHSKSPV